MQITSITNELFHSLLHESTSTILHISVHCPYAIYQKDQSEREIYIFQLKAVAKI